MILDNKVNHAKKNCSAQRTKIGKSIKKHSRNKDRIHA